MGHGPHGRWRPPDWSWEHGPPVGGFRWIRRFVFAVFLLLFVMPVALAAVLTAAFAGWTGAAVAAVVGTVVLVAGVIVARFLFNGLQIVNGFVTATSRLADGDYAARVPTDGPPAFRPVTRSFNDMAQRLEVSDELRRRLLADVGHELRTPLTIIRGELEAMADGVHEPSEAELRRLLIDVAGMERLLDDLKTLSTTEAGVLTLHREPTDLGELIVEVVERYRSEADAVGVLLRTDVRAASDEVDVDPHRIGEVVLNLLTNAVRAAAPGGSVAVTVRRDDDGAAIVDVVDDGPGLDPGQLDAIFDRFHRGAESDGSGLGLTISRGLVEAHGGTLMATSVARSGTTMTVRLPQ